MGSTPRAVRCHANPYLAVSPSPSNVRPAPEAAAPGEDQVVPADAPNAFSGVLYGPPAPPAALALAPEVEAARADYAGRIDRYRERGLEIQVGGRGLEGTLTRPMSARDLAAAAFEIDEASVRASHLERMAQANRHDPALAAAFREKRGAAELPAGQVVDLSASQRGLETADAALSAALGELEAELAALGPTWPMDQGEPPAEIAAALSELQREMEGALAHVRARKELARAHELLLRAEGQVAKGGTLDALDDAFLGPSFPGPLGYLGPRERTAEAYADSPTGRLAALAQHPDPLIREEAQALYARALTQRGRALEAFADAAGENGAPEQAARALGECADVLAALAAVEQSPAQRRALAEMQSQLLQRQAGAALGVAVARLSRGTGGALDARAWLVEGKSTPAAEAERQAVGAAFDRAITIEQHLALEAAGAERDQHLLRARLLGMERASALATVAALSPGGQPSVELGRGVALALGLSGAELDGLFSRPSAGAALSAADRAALARLEQSFADLPEALQAPAADLLVRLGEVEAAAGDRHGAAAVNGLLTSPVVGSADLPPGLRVRGALLQAEGALAAGDAGGARVLAARCRAEAQRLPQDEGAALYGRAVSLEVASLAEEAAANRSDPGQALRAMDAVIREAESSGLCSRGEVAQLLAFETTTAFSRDELALASGAYERLRGQYADVPQVAGVLSALAEHERGQVSAFARVALAQWGNSTMGEALAFTGGGAALGGAIGAGFFGIGALPGAALGATLGGLVGGVSLGGWNMLGRGGWERARQAYQTGRAAHGDAETALNAVGFGLDVLPLPAAGKALSRLGRPGLEVLSAGAKASAPAARELFAEVGEAARKEALAQGQALTQDELERRVRAKLAERFNQELLAFGGKAPAVVAGTAVTAPLAARVAEIELTLTDPAEKARAYQALAAQGGQALLALGLMFGPGLAVDYLARRPVEARGELSRSPALPSAGDEPSRAGPVDWLRSFRTPRSWSPELVREHLIATAPAAAKKELEQLAAEDLARLYPEGGAIPARFQALAQLPGFGRFAKEHPRLARLLAETYDKALFEDMWTSATGKAEATTRAFGTPTAEQLQDGYNAVYARAARGVEGQVMSPSTLSSDPRYTIATRQPTAPQWMPELHLRPKVELDHNKAWFQGARARGHVFGKRRVASEVPAPYDLRADQVVVNGAPLRSGEGLLVFSGHGGRSGFQGLSNRQAAKLVAGAILEARKEGKVIDKVVLDACHQRDRRWYVGGSNAEAFQRALNKELAGAGSVEVFAAQWGGPTYGNGQRPYWSEKSWFSFGEWEEGRYRPASEGARFYMGKNDALLLGGGALLAGEVALGAGLATAGAGYLIYRSVTEKAERPSSPTIRP